MLPLKLRLGERRNGLQQAFDISAAEFGEFIIIIPDLVEGDFFDLQCDDLITVTADKALRPKMRYRHRCNDTRCTEVSDGLDGAEHRPTRVHSVVNQQSGFALETVGNNNSPALQSLTAVVSCSFRAMRRISGSVRRICPTNGWFKCSSPWWVT